MTKRELAKILADTRGFDVTVKDAELLLEIRSVLEGVRQGADALKTLPTREELLQRAIIVATADERIDNDMQTYGRIAVSVDPLQVYLSREPSGRGPTLPKGEYRFVLFVLPKG